MEPLLYNLSYPVLSIFNAFLQNLSFIKTQNFQDIFGFFLKVHNIKRNLHHKFIKQHAVEKTFAPE